MDNLERQIKQAEENTKRWMASSIATKNVWYDRDNNEIGIEFNNGVKNLIPVELISEFKGIDKDKLSEIKVNALRDSIEIDSLDIHIDSYGLVLNHLDAKVWAYKWIGSKAGSVKSDRKAQAARKNAKLGGRPKKGLKNQLDKYREQIIIDLRNNVSIREIAQKLGHKDHNKVYRYIRTRNLKEKAKV